MHDVVTDSFNTATQAALGVTSSGPPDALTIRRRLMGNGFTQSARATTSGSKRSPWHAQVAAGIVGTM